MARSEDPAYSTRKPKFQDRWTAVSLVLASSFLLSLYTLPLYTCINACILLKDISHFPTTPPPYRSTYVRLCTSHKSSDYYKMSDLCPDRRQYLLILAVVLQPFVTLHVERPTNGRLVDAITTIVLQSAGCLVYCSISSGFTGEVSMSSTVLSKSSFIRTPYESASELENRQPAEAIRVH
jgi:hypothetical protein